MTARSLRVLLSVSLIALAGCSGGDAPPSTVSGVPSEAGPKDPIASVAYDFMKAVNAGDADRAATLLTPQAVVNFSTQGQKFAEEGMGTASFSVGEIRKEGENEAAVQFTVVDTASPDEGAEEMCCIMKRANGQWRVAAIAYQVIENGPPVVINFEAANDIAPAQAQPNAPRYTASQPPAIPVQPPRAATAPRPQTLQ